MAGLSTRVFIATMSCAARPTSQTPKVKAPVRNGVEKDENKRATAARISTSPRLRTNEAKSRNSSTSTVEHNQAVVAGGQRFLALGQPLLDPAARIVADRNPVGEAFQCLDLARRARFAELGDEDVPTGADGAQREPHGRGSFTLAVAGVDVNIA